MKVLGCERAWQAEALEDGRLGDEGRASFQRHQEQCGHCRDEARVLRLLRSHSASRTAREVSQLEHRRQRDRLLAAANATLVRARSRVIRPFAIVAVAAVLILGVIAMRAQRRGANTPPHYSITDLGAAKTSILDPGLATRVALESGTARFEVAHLSREQRFFVSLPDGEIEVRGTAFIVRVSAATEEVRVESGLVALRIAGVERLLGAGMAWERPHGSIATPLATSATSAGASSTPLPSMPPPPPVATATHPVKSGVAFADAMTAFQAADYARAERLFAEFSSAHPTDARVEDAMFLQALAASRQGETARAAAMAQTYLQAYPAGFHAADARKLTQL